MELYEFFTLLFLFITAFATSTYAWLFWKSIQPLISISIEFDKNDNLVVNLVIENSGQGPAYDVKFEIIPDFEIIKGRNLSQIGLIKNGLPFFAPHQKMMTYLTWMPADYERKINNPFTINVTYKRFQWSFPITKEFLIDLSLFGEVPLSPTPLSKIAESLEKLERRMERIGLSNFEKIKVVTYTKEENDREIEQINKELDSEDKS